MSNSEARALCKEIIACDKELENMKERKKHLENIKRGRLKNLNDWFQHTGEESITCDERTFRKVIKSVSTNRVTEKRKQLVLHEVLKKEGMRNTQRVLETYKNSIKPEKVEVEDVELVKKKKDKKKR